MIILTNPPASITFKCHNCFGVYAIERDDIVKQDGIKYGQYYSTVKCPICGGEDFVDWNHFPKTWTKEIKKVSER